MVDCPQESVEATIKMTSQPGRDGARLQREVVAANSTNNTGYEV